MEFTMKLEFKTEEEVLEIFLEIHKAERSELVPINTDCSQEFKDTWPKFPEFLEGVTRPEDVKHCNYRFYELSVVPNKIFTGNKILLVTRQNKMTMQFSGATIYQSSKDFVPAIVFKDPSIKKVPWYN